jgi:hypothetical protein
MGGGQTKVYTPKSEGDYALPERDENETPLIRLVHLVSYLDHHVPKDNQKCREAVEELQNMIAKYQDGAGLGQVDVLTQLREDNQDEHVMALIKQIATPAVNEEARRLSGSLNRTRTVFVHKKAPRLTLSDNSVDALALKGQKVDSIFHWAYDIHLLNKVTNQNPLKTMFFAVIGSLGLNNTISVESAVVDRYIGAVEKGYRTSNPYHNRCHAADVVQATGHYLKMGGIKFTDLEKVALIISAAIHDVEHPAVNNGYLVATNDHLAIAYNDKSPLENHHVSSAFMIMQREGCDIFGKVKKGIKKRLRSMMIRLVLATDMAISFDEVGKAKNIFQEDVLDMEKKDHVLQIMVMIIKLSDVSHPARNFETHYKWSQRCVEEFYLQGDKEKSVLEKEPLGFMDREKDYLPKSQWGFIKFVVVPMYATIKPIMPLLHEQMYKNIDNNINTWNKYSEKKADVKVDIKNVNLLEADKYNPDVIMAPPL